jgi:uroporphyrin-III C-methyltransferase
MTMKEIKVTLVGAGPGDPDLITVKAMKAIQSADAILYDALVGEKILEYAAPYAELIYVGKRCGQHSLTQADINALLAQTAQRVGHVVRLKGGDPFIFGRGHEELVFLKKKGITVNVVPGISSATSLSLLQEVPLTRRRVAESFWVITGTTKSHELSGDISLAAQSTATVVILMGMRKLTEICKLFSNAGKRETPVMVIQNGSQESEKVVLGAINDISKKVKVAGVGAPGIIIIGEVVRLHPEFVHQKTLEAWI